MGMMSAATTRIIDPESYSEMTTQSATKDVSLIDTLMGTGCDDSVIAQVVDIAASGVLPVEKIVDAIWLSSSSGELFEIIDRMAGRVIPTDPDGALVPLPEKILPERAIPPMPMHAYRVWVDGDVSK